jgi:hypothetical protein
MQSMPDTASVATHNRYWTKRVWREAREQPEFLFEKHSQSPSQAAVLHQALVQQANQQSMRVAGFRGVDYADAIASESPATAAATMGGWDGRPTALWRIEVGDYFWSWLQNRAGSMKDFLGAYIDLRAVRSDAAGYRKLWLEEIQSSEVSREWLRFAVMYTQLQWRLAKSNARDGQHSMYLTDAHLFLTTDARFVRTLEAVRRQSNFDFAEPRLVAPGTAPWIERLLDTVERDV